MTKRLIALMISGALLAADLLIKAWVKRRLEGGAAVVLIPRVLQLRYVENRGVSFSALAGSPAAMRIVSIVTGLMLLAGVVCLLLGKIKETAPVACGVMILAGGLGNLVDRMFRGYVVDYIETLFVNFAVFNFADILISCGVFLLAGWLILFEGKAAKKTKAVSA